MRAGIGGGGIGDAWQGEGGYRMKGKHTCNRPLSSRSPRNLTKTISSMERRTRSRGSETVAAAPAVESSARSAIFVLRWMGKSLIWCGEGFSFFFFSKRESAVAWRMEIVLVERHCFVY